MPGFCASSSCIARVSGVRKVVPERRSSAAIAATASNNMTTSSASLMRSAGPHLRASADGQLQCLALHVAVIVGPLEHHVTAHRRAGEEGDVRVGGGAGMQVGAEHLLAGIGAGEAVDDVAPDG